MGFECNWIFTLFLLTLTTRKMPLLLGLLTADFMSWFDVLLNYFNCKSATLRSIGIIGEPIHLSVWNSTVAGSCKNNDTNVHPR